MLNLLHPWSLSTKLKMGLLERDYVLRYFGNTFGSWGVTRFYVSSQHLCLKFAHYYVPNVLCSLQQKDTWLDSFKILHVCYSTKLMHDGCGQQTGHNSLKHLWYSPSIRDFFIVDFVGVYRGIINALTHFKLCVHEDIIHLELDTWTTLEALGINNRCFVFVYMCWKIEIFNI